MRKRLTKQQRILKRRQNFQGAAFRHLLVINHFKGKYKVERERLNAIANGFSVWQTINIEADGDVVNWFCQYGIDKIAHGHTMREAIDAALKVSKEEA